MKKLTRDGWCWRDEEGTAYIWLVEYESFQNQKTGELRDIKEFINEEEVIME